MQIKKLITAFVATVATTMALAQETIVVLNPQGPTHSGTPQLLAVLNEANKMQKKYNFIVEFKPGAFESIALNELAGSPQTKISTMTNASVEGFDRKLSKETDLVPIFSQGDSCWAVIGVTKSNQGLDSFKTVNEIVVGTGAIGGATHLAALEVGRRYNKPVRVITYKSNFDAFMTMVADGSINFVFERVKNYEAYKSKNPNLQMLAMSCAGRHPAAPDIKTLREYGIRSPFLWQQIVANRNINPERAKEFEAIFTEATRKVGRTQIFELSDQTPAIFQNMNSATHFKNSLSTLREYRLNFKQEIEATR